jgi:hypothetical protein
MDAKRLRIGELLIEAGVLSQTQLREALDLQKQTPRPLGVILVENRYVTEAQLIQALSRQLSIPWVSLWHVDVAPELLAIVTREEADQHHILPIYARTVRGERPALFVAMDDPTNQQALEFVREVAGMDVRPMIAAPTDLRQAIKALYSGEEEEDEELSEQPLPPPIMSRRSAPPPPPRIARSAPPPPTDDAVELTEPADEEPPAEPGSSDLAAGLAAASSVPPEPTAAAEPAPAADAEAPTFLVPGALESGAAAPPPEAPEVTGVGPAPEAPEVTGVGPAPEPAALGNGRAAVLEVSEATRKRRQRRALAFTFLDGTSIAVGGGDTAPAPGAEHAKLDELVATLRRFADDPNVPEPYGPRGLSLVVAALLEILSRKALISEAEWAETIARLTRGH